MNTKLLSFVLGLAVLGSLASFYLSNSSKSQFQNFTLKDVELYSHIDPDELHYRVSLFNDWAKKNQKQYSVEEAAIRFHNWNKNYEYVENHNSKNLSWTLEMNLFADLSVPEFAALYLGYRADLYNEAQEANNIETEVSTDESNEEENLEDSDEGNLEGDIVDWRKQNKVTDIRNQGSCGSCYAFASAAALESLRAIKGGRLGYLSPQQLVDCSSGQGNQGCNGGLMVYSYQYTKANGLLDESAYPYQAAKGTCRAKSGGYRNTGYTSVPSNNGKSLQAAVKKQPVSVAVQASTQTFQLYKSGVIKGSSCGTSLDHAITAVGYSAKSWICKNQWGTNWGNKGYVRIEYTSSGAGTCGINSQASYPTV